MEGLWMYDRFIMSELSSLALWRLQQLLQKSHLWFTEVWSQEFRVTQLLLHCLLKYING